MGRQHIHYPYRATKRISYGTTTHYVYRATIHTVIMRWQYTNITWGDNTLTIFVCWQHTHILGTDNALHIFMARQNTVLTRRHHIDFLRDDDAMTILVKRQHILFLRRDNTLTIFMRWQHTNCSQGGDNTVTSYGATIRWLFLWGDCALTVLTVPKQFHSFHNQSAFSMNLMASPLHLYVDSCVMFGALISYETWHEG
jgi:hypothetical protein